MANMESIEKRAARAAFYMEDYDNLLDEIRADTAKELENAGSWENAITIMERNLRQMKEYEQRRNWYAVQAESLRFAIDAMSADK